ncbi:hypothetical protein IV37_GL000182 [Fructilactobacillus fructivorans]|uniref:hypothetical protein n=1 Tax=Fructilactobacillus fructivorans TaxID=1614 RepID=UPI000704DD10|nr:hypothetical protein [Fructilactobacillus fructivorans]KRN13460.1 hypothetical protein IV37_GL000182 [Fructilactobacillus fructivorans]
MAELPSKEEVTGLMDCADDISDVVFNELVNEANKVAVSDGVSDDMLKTATTWLTRHLIYINLFMGSGGVTSAATLGNSQTIADHTQNDPYLQHYEQIVNQFGSGDSLGSVTTE